MYTIQSNVVCRCCYMLVIRCACVQADGDVECNTIINCTRTSEHYLFTLI